MPVSIDDALQAFEERKRAVTNDDDAVRMVATEEQIKLAMVGLGVDFEELAEAAQNRSVLYASPLAELVADLVANVWADGLLTGLLLAELRAKEGE